MPALPDDQSDTATEREWREVFLEAENLRRDYEQHLRDADGVKDADERASGRLWLRLWRAERRRDEFLRRPD